MRRSTALLVPLLATPLASQVAFFSTSKSDEKPPANLQEWTQKLKDGAFPEWVLLPGAAQDWTGQVGTLLDTDAALLEIGVEKESFGATNTVAKELRAREGWGPETRWALMGKDGSVLDSAASAPDAAALRATLDRHGVQGTIQMLEAFLGRHPDRRDAEDRLLSYRLQLAGKLMRPFLKPQEKPKDKFVDAAFLPPQELAKPLTDADDARIWSRCAALMEASFQSGDWLQGFSSWTFRLTATGAILSPTMQAVTARSLPTIEAALQRDPRDFAAWDAWVRVQDVAGGRPIRPLIDSLTPLPLPGSSVLPTEYPLGFYINGTKRRQQWGNIVDLVQPWWDEHKDDHWKVVAMDMNGKPVDTLKDTWDRLLGPLVESYLRLGRAYDADRVVREAMDWRPSPGLPQWSAALARRCGDEQMASQWARIVVPKQPAQ